MAQNDTPTPRVLTCTPNGLVNKYPCAKCASATELIAMIALVTYTLQNQGAHDLTDMLESGKCFKCLSNHQMIEGILNAMIEVALANGYFTDVNEFFNTAKCLTCADPALVRGIILKGYCDMMSVQLAAAQPV